MGGFKDMEATLMAKEIPNLFKDLFCSLREFWEIQRRSRRHLKEWHTVMVNAQWKNLSDLPQIYPSADQVTVKSGGIVTVFNVGRNKYRLITAIHYNTQTIYVLSVMDHSRI